MTHIPKPAAEYKRMNPLGGPAVIFEAIADLIRAGDTVEMAMALHSVMWAPKVPPAAQAHPPSRPADLPDELDGDEVTE